MKTSGSMLLSASFITKSLTEYGLYAIPANILEHKKLQGSQVMDMLEEMFNNKDSNVDNYFYSENIKLRVQALIDFFIANKVKIMFVEKFITDSKWCGFIDIIGKCQGQWVLYEIKCRNDTTLKNSDKLQVGIYRKMLHNIKSFVLVVNDSLQVVEHEVKETIVTKFLDGINLASNTTIPQPEKIEVN